MTTRFPAIPTPRPDDIESIARSLLACKQTLDMLLAAPYTNDTVVQAGTLADLITKLGIKGAQGIQGKRGYVGPPGGDGDEGPMGVQGKRGLVGKRGYLGQRGEDGEDGLQGLQGRRGTPGQRGLRGHTGDDGAEGEPGVTIPGKRGARGLRGFIGAPGSDGDEAAFQPGPRGRDGISIDFGMQVNGDFAVNLDAITTVTLVNNTSRYTVDCWKAYYNHAAATAVITASQQTAAFGNFTSGSYSLFLQATTALSAPANTDFAFLFTPIEGYRVAKLGWGLSWAIPITIAFWAYSTAGGVALVRVTNSAGDRAYHAEVTLTASGPTWVTLVIPGDTSGTWLTTTGVGLYVSIFAAGKEATPATPNAWGATAKTQSTNSVSQLGTNNNYFGINTFHLFPGSATPATLNLARLGELIRGYDTEQALCGRYYQTSYNGVAPGTATVAGYVQVQMSPLANSVWSYNISVFFDVMRAAPTMTAYSYQTGTAGKVRDVQNAADVAGSFAGIGLRSATINVTVNAATTVLNMAFHWLCDARL